MLWVKKLILVVSNRKAQDKLLGVGMTIQNPRVCLPDAIYFSKIRFWVIVISDHMIPRKLIFFVEICLKVTFHAHLAYEKLLHP